MITTLVVTCRGRGALQLRMGMVGAWELTTPEIRIMVVVSIQHVVNLQIMTALTHKREFKNRSFFFFFKTRGGGGPIVQVPSPGHPDFMQSETHRDILR